MAEKQSMPLLDYKPPLDVGFRVFRQTESCFKDGYVRNSASKDCLLWQIINMQGMAYDTRVSRVDERDIPDNQVFIAVDENPGASVLPLYICMDSFIAKGTVDMLASYIGGSKFVCFNSAICDGDIELLEQNGGICNVIYTENDMERKSFCEITAMEDGASAILSDLADMIGHKGNKGKFSGVLDPWTGRPLRLKTVQSAIEFLAAHKSCIELALKYGLGELGLAVDEKGNVKGIGRIKE